MPKAGGAKAKISVTVAADLVAQIDRGVRARRYLSRSAAIETALQRWAREERRRQTDAEIEAYYAGMTDEERAEDRRWAELAHTSLDEIDRQGEGSRGPVARAPKRRRAR